MSDTVRVKILGDASSLERALGRGGAALGRFEATAGQHALGFKAKLGGAFQTVGNQLAAFGVPFTGALAAVGGKLEEASTRGSGALARLGHVADVTTVAVGAGLLAVGVSSIHAADDFERSHARLENALSRLGVKWQDYAGKINATNSRLENLGFTNAETENALARLVPATGSVTKATELMGLAADISRARHIDLETATDLLVKVEGKRYTQLGRLLGVSKDTIASFKDQDDALKFLTDRFGGAAQRNADTFAGKLEVLKAKGTDLAKDIGVVLIPIVEKFFSGLLAGIGYLQTANDATGGWLGKLGLIAVGGLVAISVVSRLAIAIKAMAAAIVDAVETATIWVMLNPELAAVLAAVAVAVGAVIAVLHLFSGGQDQAKKAAEGFTQAMEQQNITLGTAIDRGLVKWIEKDEQARRMLELHHISLGEFSDAIQGNQTAYHHVITVLDQYIAKQGESGIGMSAGAAVALELKNKLVTLAGGYREAKRETHEHNQATQELSHHKRDATQRTGELTDATLREADANRKDKNSLKDLIDRMNAAAKARQELTDAELGGIDAGLRLEGATNTLAKDYQDYIDKVKAAAAAGGKNTQANDDLRDASLTLRTGILDVAKAAGEAAAAHDLERQKLGENVTEQDIARDRYDAARAALELMRQKYPLLGDAIDEYLRHLAQTPGDVTTHVHADTDDAMARIRAVNEEMTRLIREGKITFHFEAGSFGVGSAQHGGWVKASRGRPVPYILHGGEYVSSVEELAGRPRADSPYARVGATPTGGGMRLNGGGGGFVFAPVIYAFDGRGVEDALIRVLKRFRDNNGTFPWERH